jgi:RNA polymerase sigma-70 factor (ECF subfamily)
LEEQLLVTSAQRGDKAAFAQLVEHYQTAVYNLAFRMLGNANDAEDAAQETFLRAYTRLKSFNGDQKFATWLLSIDAHYCIDRLRRRKHFTWLSLEDEMLADSLRSDLPGPAEETLRQESQQEVERLLEHLSVANRLVVVLRYWHELSIEEIAKTTGDSVSAIKVRLHRARQALAREMAGHDQVDGLHGRPTMHQCGVTSAVGGHQSAVKGVN